MASKSPDLPPDPEALRYSQAVLQSSLPQKDKIARLARPAILASAPRVSSKAPLGASRLGGEPDLPPDIPWPQWKGRHQAFVAQIDLGELPECPGRELLPLRGHLYFFYALDCDEKNPLPSGLYSSERGAFPVLFSERLAPDLRRTGFPADIPEDCRYRPLRMSFAVINSIPDSPHPALRALGLETTELQLKYAEVVEGCEPELRTPAHNQILGYPQPIQNSVCLDIQEGVSDFWVGRDGRTKEAEEQLWAAILKSALEWELLLQVDTQDDKNGMIWGDCGRLFWMIRRQDLAERRFDRAWFSLQSS